ncbi:hypothetical protein P7K49_030340 [Saguinus oedipus]|uniref:SSD domain-containing protein n=1 Tax=Saguinus oedipus TaxID=9490 RepID=A0ABQ9U2N0_SAGOE|nr:hypothetical protein P7K49_030340 [Saguinus oedipus]
MKNMATELGIILIGYFTLVPAIQRWRWPYTELEPQTDASHSKRSCEKRRMPSFVPILPPELAAQLRDGDEQRTDGLWAFSPGKTVEFCLFAVVGLVSDFFLQMLFFTTVLSIDIRRMELADLNKRLPPEACLPSAKPVGQPTRYERQLAVRPSTPHTITLQPSSFRNLRLPKRLRVIYFLARTRLAQRLIMSGKGCSSGPGGPWKPGSGELPVVSSLPRPWWLLRRQACLWEKQLQGSQVQEPSSPQSGPGQEPASRVL